jgi:hypothetical protein
VDELVAYVEGLETALGIESELTTLCRITSYKRGEETSAVVYFTRSRRLLNRVAAEGRYKP